jgi:anti-sigma28 factor (negative regulator of flagellin synthesis)
MELRPDNDRRFARPEKAQQGLEQHAQNLAESKARARTAMRRTAQAKSQTAEAMRNLHRKAHGDTVDLSSTARAFTEQVTSDDGARAELVASLKVAYSNGTLNTPERVERAAEKLMER